jgi:hypothetical protein
MMVNGKNLDFDDMQVILSSSRGMPLSEMEKAYIDEMHTTLEETTNILWKIIQAGRNEILSSDPGLYDSALDLISASRGITGINSDLIGRGYIFTVKEDDGQNNKR